MFDEREEIENLVNPIIGKLHQKYRTRGIELKLNRNELHDYVWAHITTELNGMIEMAICMNILHYECAEAKKYHETTGKYIDEE